MNRLSSPYSKFYRWQFYFIPLAIPCFLAYAISLDVDTVFFVYTIPFLLFALIVFAYMFSYMKRLSEVFIDGDKLVISSPKGTITARRNELAKLEVLEVFGYKFIELEISNPAAPYNPLFLESMMMKLNEETPKAYQALSKWKKEVEPTD